MNEIVGSTAEEKRMIKAWQLSMGILANGYVGTDTVVSTCEKLGADCFPIAVTMYGCPTVVSKTCIPFDPDGPISPYNYTMSGSFTEPPGGSPCSILVNKDKILCSYACHYWTMGKPESVMYRLSDGSVWVKRCLTIAELPKGVEWAIGGMGLLDYYDPESEGFTGKYAGALRCTGHIVLGYKNGYIYGVAVSNKTAAEVNNLCKKKFCFEKAIMLDGGSVFFYNLPGFKRGINTICGYAVQFI